MKKRMLIVRSLRERMVFFINPIISSEKQTEYILLDMTQIMSDLTPGDTMEIPEAYIGRNLKLPARVIIHR